MYKDLLRHLASSLLVLPLIAMFLFLAVFIVIVARALTRSRDEVNACASLPLMEERSHERR
jgi:hypothetical protein